MIVRNSVPQLRTLVQLRGRQLSRLSFQIPASKINGVFEVGTALHET